MLERQKRVIAGRTCRPRMCGTSLQWMKMEPLGMMFGVRPVRLEAAKDERSSNEYLTVTQRYLTTGWSRGGVYKATIFRQLGTASLCVAHASLYLLSRTGPVVNYRLLPVKSQIVMIDIKQAWRETMISKINAGRLPA